MSNMIQFTDKLKSWHKGKTLKSLAIKGGAYLGISNGVDRLLRLIRNMILTRMLAPEVFGIMAIVLAIDRIFETLTEIGIKKAIIQNKRGHEKTYLNGAWWLAFSRGTVIYILTFLFAPVIANFYENPDLTMLIRVAFLSILFNGAMSPRAHVAIKNMDYGRWVLITQGSAVVGIATTIATVFFINSVWALVIGFLTESAARFILSFIICPYLPGIQFDKESLRSLLKFAKGMLGLPILTFIFMRADIFVIGKLCSQSELGLYSMAFALSQVPFQTLISIINQVILPIFSKKQEDKEWINVAVLKITSALVYFCFPILAFSIIYGKDLLSIVYGVEYAKASLPFIILFASAMMRTLGIPIVQVYWAKNRPELNRRFTAIRAVLIIIMIYPAVKYFGLVGAAASSLIAMIISLIFQILQIAKVTDLNLGRYAKVLVEGVFLSIGAIIIYCVSLTLAPDYFNIKFILGSILCFLTLILSFWHFVKYKTI